MDSDLQIIEAYRTGDRERASAAFVRKHQRFVYGIARRYLRDHDDAQDATQEVMIRALAALDGFQQQSALQTWLYRITVNVCTSSLRRARLRSLLRLDFDIERQQTRDRSSQPDHQVQQHDLTAFLNGVLATLPQRQREAFCMRYFDELSYAEMREITGTSEGALKANYHWAVKKIAAAMNNSDFRPSSVETNIE
jgi:RNA polymerase sigma-70 factor (ECF subfamily)